MRLAARPVGAARLTFRRLSPEDVDERPDNGSLADAGAAGDDRNLLRSAIFSAAAWAGSKRMPIRCSAQATALSAWMAGTAPASGAGAGRGWRLPFPPGADAPG